MPVDLPGSTKPKILVADDEPNWLRVLAVHLRGRDCDVTTALNGREAIEKIDAEKPDLIIADITMPGMDGYELCRHLRRNAATRTIPFIFLTAHDQDAERLKARRIGADEYLTKPCSLDRVVQSVRTAMERIEQAKKLSLEQIGSSGRIEDIDLLDLIQALELEQRTGALVLSHGERTGTIYLKGGVIVEADIRSPAREEPLFRLLGWKTGRFAFIPDAVPEQTPITASMAHLLFEDLRLLEEHERQLPPPVDAAAPDGQTVDGEPIAGLLALLEDVGRRYAATRLPSAPPMILRILVVGTATAPTTELIRALIADLSGWKWAALERNESPDAAQTEIGRVRLAADLALHLIAVRGEQRFWPVWEQYLPESIGALFLLPARSDWEQASLRGFLVARDIIAPSMPVLLSLPEEPLDAGAREGQSTGAVATDMSRERALETVVGSQKDQRVRLTLLSRLLHLWQSLHPE